MSRSDSVGDSGTLLEKPTEGSWKIQIPQPLGLESDSQPKCRAHVHLEISLQPFSALGLFVFSHVVYYVSVLLDGEGLISNLVCHIASITCTCSIFNMN